MEKDYNDYQLRRDNDAKHPLDLSTANKQSEDEVFM